MNRLADNRYNLRFTMEYIQRSLAFLDLTILKRNDVTLETSLYRKPTVANTILHTSSSHPKSLIKSIPYSQYLRIRRNCSNEENFRRKSYIIKFRLLQRGYTKTTLKKAFNKTCEKERHDLFFGKVNTKQSESVRIVTTYSGNHKLIRETIRKHWHLLTGDPIVNKYISDFPQITYKKCQSLKGRLIHRYFQEPSGSN